MNNQEIPLIIWLNSPHSTPPLPGVGKYFSICAYALAHVAYIIIYDTKKERHIMRPHPTILTLLLFGFLLGIHEGKIALWKDGQSTPSHILPYSARMLPKEFRQQLENGIHIESEEDLERLLESLYS